MTPSAPRQPIPEGLSVQVTDRVATLRIDRPQARGALTARMWAALPGILADLADDPATAVLVLTGSNGVFSAGADLTELRHHYATPQAAEAYHAGNAAAEHALATFPKPTLALVSGACVGGGCQLATACDLCFADPTATFGVTPARFGIAYGAASTRRLADRVGASAAKYLLFSAELIDAHHALRIGLVDRLLDQDRATEQGYAFARTIAGRSQLTVRAAKDLLATPGVDPERARAWERAAQTSGDVPEAIAAFTERRTPRFTWDGPSPVDPPQQHPVPDPG